MSASSRTIRSVQPGLRGLVALVAEASFASAGGILPAEGTLYGSSEFKSLFGKDYNKLFQNYVYLGQGEDAKDGGYLNFAPPKTTAEANIPFRTTTKFGNHYWHPILLELKPLEVIGFPLQTLDGSTNTNAVRYNIRERYIPGATEGTRFVTEEFLSPIPFVIPQYPTPVPSAVSFDFISRYGSFPECLHDKIIIPRLTTTTGNQLPAQIFPATNFTTWGPYVLSDVQTLTPSGYHRVRTRVYPPPLPEELIRILR